MVLIEYIGSREQGDECSLTINYQLGDDGRREKKSGEQIPGCSLTIFRTIISYATMSYVFQYLDIGYQVVLGYKGRGRDPT